MFKLVLNLAILLLLKWLLLPLLLTSYDVHLLLEPVHLLLILAVVGYYLIVQGIKRRLRLPLLGILVLSLPI